jgi:hypothetical protein
MPLMLTAISIANLDGQVPAPIRASYENQQLTSGFPVFGAGIRVCESSIGLTELRLGFAGHVAMQVLRR